MWNINKHFKFGLMFDTASANTKIHKGVTIPCLCQEKDFSSFLQLPQTNVVNLAFSIQLHQDLCTHVYDVA